MISRSNQRVHFRPVVVLLCVLVISATAFGQCRTPTAKEKAAIDKLVKVLKQEIITPLLPTGWRVASEKSAQTMQVTLAESANPPRPLMDCTSLFDFRLQAAPDSKRYQEYQAAVKNVTGSPDDMKKLLPVMASAEVDIKAGENNPTMRAPHTGEYKELKMDGPTVAYQIPGKDSSEAVVTTVLCYGGFKRDVVLGGQNTRVMYSFVHKPGTPFIENFCVNIKTSPEVTDEVLKLVNWENLKQALTP